MVFKKIATELFIFKFITYAFCAFLLVLSPNANAGGNTAATTLIQAKRIYRYGILPSAEPIRAVVQSDIELTGTLVACANCHRRSAMGTTEGSLVVPPVTGEILFQPKTQGRKDRFKLKTEGVGVRPAYTEATLRKVIRKGTDPSGRELDRQMPRYELSDQDVDLLIAYMKTISASGSPGISDSEMHFATIVTDKVDEAQKKAMLDVMEKFFTEKNAGTRHETRRAKYAPWHRDWKYQAYRKWKLHVWKLQGKPDTWFRQLTEYYAEQPVFAMLSGLAQGSWAPIHEFCEVNEIPCLYPNTNLPVLSETDYYTFYFYKGVSLEADVLANYLVNQADPETLNNVVQIYRLESEGAVAATRFGQLMHQRNVKTLKPIVFQPQQTVDVATWQQMVQQYPNSIMIFWLEKADFAALAGIEEGKAATSRWYISATLNHDWAEAVPETFRNNTYVIYPYAQPSKLERRLQVSNIWLKSRKIQSNQRIIQANTYFTMRALGRTIMHLRDKFSREYFIELLEHEVEKMLVSSVFPRMTLGPGQRYASKGAYILKLSSNNSSASVPISDWIIPVTKSLNFEKNE